MFHAATICRTLLTATFEIIGESRPLLNKNAGCSSITLTERNSANQIFRKMLQNFLQHLMHLSTEAPPGNNF